MSMTTAPTATAPASTDTAPPTMIRKLVKAEEIDHYLQLAEPRVRTYYQTAYGDAEEAGWVDNEAFHPRYGGGLVVATRVQEHAGEEWELFAGMVGWNNLGHLHYPKDQRQGIGDPYQVAEIKRLYVAPSARGKGLARQMEMEALRAIFEDHLYTMAVGETGYAQKASQHMHQKSPWQLVAPFGAHYQDAGSLFWGTTRGLYRSYRDHQAQMQEQAQAPEQAQENSR